MQHDHLILLEKGRGKFDQEQFTPLWQLSGLVGMWSVVFCMVKLSRRTHRSPSGSSEMREAQQVRTRCGR